MFSLLCGVGSTVCGCSVPAAPTPVAWFMERYAPNLIQRMLNEFIGITDVGDRANSPGCLLGIPQKSLNTEVKRATGSDASTFGPVAVPADGPCKSSQGSCSVHKARRA